MSRKKILMVAAVREELAQFRSPLNGQVQTVLTGMGREAALNAVEAAVSKEHFDLVVSTGFAGGTRPGFQVGDLVMASEVLDAQSGRRFHPNRALYGLNGLASVGTMVTGSELLPTPQAKAEFGAKHGGIAVDLESAAVAEVAQKHGTPWVALRAILDPMEAAVPAGSWVSALRVLIRPARWKDFRAFLGAIQTASQSLATGLKLMVEQSQQREEKGDR